jgi:hypothetical protein
MNEQLSMPARRDLRQRMIEDMSVRGFSAKTQHDYQRIVSRYFDKRQTPCRFKTILSA